MASDFSPGGSAVFACHHANEAIGDDDAVWPGRMNEHAVDVAFLRIGVDRQLDEALPKIHGHLVNPFDPHQHRSPSRTISLM